MTRPHGGKVPSASDNTQLADLRTLSMRRCTAKASENISVIDELADGIAERRLRLLKQAVPSISRIAVLSSAPTESGHRKAFAEAEHAAVAIGVTLTNIRISDATDLSAVFALMV